MSDDTETTTYACPVCGYGGLDAPAYDRSGNGSYEICPSCGYEFGVTDADKGIGHEQWRARWIEQQMPWYATGVVEPPTGWDPAAQVAAITHGPPVPGETD